MSAETPPSSDEPARFERHCRLLRDVGMSPELTVRQLLLAGFPREWVRAEFPTLPDSLFELPTPPEISRRSERLRNARAAVATAEASSRAGQVALGSVLPAQAIADRVFRKSAADVASSSTTPPAHNLTSNPARSSGPPARPASRELPAV